MKIEDRWATDNNNENFAREIEPVDSVRSWDQAVEHLKSTGLSEEQIENANRADLPERQVADHLAGQQGYIYPNYRPL